MNMERNEVKQCKERERETRRKQKERVKQEIEREGEREIERKGEREIGGRNNSFVVAIYSNSCLGYR